MNVRTCSVTRNLRITPGDLEDYKRLAHFHYRDSREAAFTSIFVIRPAKNLAARFGATTIGVIGYRMPSPGLELRSVATDNLFAGLDNTTRMAVINKNIRCISRVIIEPRFRGLGLAGRIVRETMPKINVPIIEAMAVMGLVNPFFERAGMTPFTAKIPLRCVQLAEALSTVGIEQQQLIDPRKVQRKLDKLSKNKAEFIEGQIVNFLHSYGEKRNMKPGIERTRFVLSRLTERPVYYIWFNPKLKLVTH
ncbi:MAG TPA: hypothetical protein VMX13_10450 [Sedimentisphaerales bacterium]|nr:hypothetical protein [Sedimentisphaerales bacterium]